MMRINNVDHILRAAGEVTGQTRFVLIGSAAVIAWQRVVPPEMAMTREVDLFAMDAEEVDLGASCVAMPIFTDGSQATYALSLSGPTARVKSQQKSILAELTKACQVISEMLKY